MHVSGRFKVFRVQGLEASRLYGTLGGLPTTPPLGLPMMESKCLGVCKRDPSAWNLPGRNDCCSFAVAPHVFFVVPVSLFFLTFLWVSSCLMCCRPPCLRALPSRKHLGRALVRLKSALSLGASSKKHRCIAMFDQQIGYFAFKAVLLEGSVPELVAPRLNKSALPFKTSLKFQILLTQKLRSRSRQFDVDRVLIIFIYWQKSRSRAEHPRNFVDLSASNSMKMTLRPATSFGVLRLRLFSEQYGAEVGIALL